MKLDNWNVDRANFEVHRDGGIGGTSFKHMGLQAKYPGYSSVTLPYEATSGSYGATLPGAGYTSMWASENDCVLDYSTTGFWEGFWWNTDAGVGGQDSCPGDSYRLTGFGLEWVQYSEDEDSMNTRFRSSDAYEYTMKRTQPSSSDDIAKTLVELYNVRDHQNYKTDLQVAKDGGLSWAKGANHRSHLEVFSNELGTGDEVSLDIRSEEPVEWDWNLSKDGGMIAYTETTFDNQYEEFDMYDSCLKLDDGPGHKICMNGDLGYLNTTWNFEGEDGNTFWDTKGYTVQASDFGDANGFDYRVGDEYDPDYGWQTTGEWAAGDLYPGNGWVHYWQPHGSIGELWVNPDWGQLCSFPPNDDQALCTTG